MRQNNQTIHEQIPTQRIPISMMIRNCPKCGGILERSISGIFLKCSSCGKQLSQFLPTKYSHQRSTS